MRNSKSAYLFTYIYIWKLVFISIIHAVSIPPSLNTIQTNKLTHKQTNMRQSSFNNIDIYTQPCVLLVKIQIFYVQTFFYAVFNSFHAVLSMIFIQSILLFRNFSYKIQNSNATQEFSDTEEDEFELLDV